MSVRSESLRDDSTPGPVAALDGAPYRWVGRTLTVGFADTEPMTGVLTELTQTPDGTPVTLRLQVGHDLASAYLAGPYDVPWLAVRYLQGHAR